MSSLKQGMMVTVETAADLKHCVGRRAKVLKVVGVFAVLDVEEMGVRGCVVDGVQPVVTREMMGAGGDTSGLRGADDEQDG